MTRGVASAPWGRIGSHRGSKSSNELTPREYEVVRRFAAGQKWEVIMADLGITRATVHQHRIHALAKYDASCMVELYQALGWLRVPG